MATDSPERTYRVIGVRSTGARVMIARSLTLERADLVKRALNSAYKDVTVEEMPDVGHDTVADAPAHDMLPG